MERHGGTVEKCRILTPLGVRAACAVGCTARTINRR